ncbi:MAG TPA: cellulase family glycosylhydrolase [Blastocatellia bacterium]|nr:cellulase family glycosylhydrolase [Blastocatellia bacterium]
MDGTVPFRFVSFNAPLLLADPWPTLSDSAEVIEGQNWEREDAVKTLTQFAGSVARTFVISTQGEFPKPTGAWIGKRKHVTWEDGNIQFDEALFQGMDRALELANQYGLRVIIPLVAENPSGGSLEAWGGVYAYSRATGGRNFYTDNIAKAEFKKTIEFILRRVNTRTGVQYKDDPAILAWETGNELEADPQEWTEEMARFIKSIDQNHLVMDGHYGIRDASLAASSAIDIVSSHNYGGRLDAGAVWGDRNRSRGRKPFIAGEFGTHQGGDATRVRDFLDAVIASGITGALIWDLKPHSRIGGFQVLCDGSSDSSCSYHWPGFTRVPFRKYQNPDEKPILSLIVEAASRIRGFPPGGDGRIGNPDPPKLLWVRQGGDFDLNGRWRGPNFQLRWRGSPGADAYVIERAVAEGGPWTTLSRDASDNFPLASVFGADDPFYTDVSSKRVGDSFWYRVSAQFIRSNGARDVSDPSNAVRSPVAGCGGSYPDTDINACGAGGMDLPYSSNPSTCGQVVVDPCGVRHVCSPCLPPPPCDGNIPCWDGSCPRDHGGVCPPEPCPRSHPVRCPDGTCVKAVDICPVSPLKKSTPSRKARKDPKRR